MRHGCHLLPLLFYIVLFNSVVILVSATEWKMNSNILEKLLLFADINEIDYAENAENWLKYRANTSM